LRGGPQDGKVITYPQPLPETIVTASFSPMFVYHQYCHGSEAYTYHHEFTYRVNELGLMEIL